MPIAVKYTNHFNTGGSQLGAGVRAGPGTVGYLGSESNLTTLTAGQSLTGTSLAGNASWDGGILRVTTAGFTVSGFKLPGIYSTADGLTVEGCVLDRNGVNDMIYGVSLFHPTGTLTVRDTTIRDSAPNGQGAQCIGSDNGIVDVRRCDLSGYEDGMGHGSSAFISQVYVHGLDGTGTDPHNDCLQHFPNGLSGAVIEHSYLSLSEHGNESVEATGTSGCVTFKTDGPMTLNNCYLEKGAIFFRMEAGSHDLVVTNNNFGPLGSMIALVSKDPGCTIATWTNNRDSSNNLIAQP